MSTLSTFQKSAKKAGLELVSQGSSKVQELVNVHQQHFPADKCTTNAVRQACRGGDASGGAMLVKNDAVAGAVDAALDTVDTVQSYFAVVEQYVTLTIPKMEDGNNFGVTVQLAAIKTITDANEKLDKAVEDLSKYYASRADAMEKCKLGSTKSSTKTTSKTESTSDSKSPDPEAKTNGTSTESKTVSEEKQVETAADTSGQPDIEYRKAAVTAVDVLYYSKAKKVSQAALTACAAVLDFCDKNKDKLEKPKGSGGGMSGYSSMY